MADIISGLFQKNTAAGAVESRIIGDGERRANRRAARARRPRKSA
jgi:hypothetical protein